MVMTYNTIQTKEGSNIIWGQTYAEIDLDALSANVKELKAHVGKEVRLAVAVKANAYGHGAIPIALEAIKAGASYLLVARLEEGVQLRLAGIKAPILVMGYIVPSEMKRAVKYDITITVIDEKQVHAAAEAAATQRVKVLVHLKVDTGMNRNGTDQDAILSLAKLIGKYPALSLEGLYSHFARADEECKTTTNRQFDKFIAVSNRLKDEGINIPIRHIANSAATIDLPEMHLDMVRCGISIYGLYGSKEVSRTVRLEPILTLVSRIDRIHELLPGDGVSYGHDFVATKPTKAALVSIGYGDGFQRCLSNRAEVLIKGQRAKILGRICMDQLVVDVSEIEEVEIGDRVILIGEDGQERVSVAELAETAETNENEIVTGLSARIPRLYFSKRKLVKITDLNESHS